VRAEVSAIAPQAIPQPLRVGKRFVDMASGPGDTEEEASTVIRPLSRIGYALGVVLLPRGGGKTSPTGRLITLWALCRR
jgi:hypothetical protein